MVALLTWTATAGYDACKLVLVETSVQAFGAEASWVIVRNQPPTCTNSPLLTFQQSRRYWVTVPQRPANPVSQTRSDFTKTCGSFFGDSVMVAQ